MINQELWFPHAVFIAASAASIARRQAAMSL